MLCTILPVVFQLPRVLQVLKLHLVEGDLPLQSVHFLHMDSYRTSWSDISYTEFTPDAFSTLYQHNNNNKSVPLCEKS